MGRYKSSAVGLNEMGGKSSKGNQAHFMNKWLMLHVPSEYKLR